MTIKKFRDEIENCSITVNRFFLELHKADCQLVLNKQNLCNKNGLAVLFGGTSWSTSKISITIFF